jgi:hypothetical protein
MLSKKRKADGEKMGVSGTGIDILIIGQKICKVIGSQILINMLAWSDPVSPNYGPAALFGSHF